MTPDEEAYWDAMFEMADDERDNWFRDNPPAQHWCCDKAWREGHLADCVLCTNVETLNLEFTVADKAWLDNFGIVMP